MTFRESSRVVPRPCTQMTQVLRMPGTNQAGRAPSSPGMRTSSWSRPRAEPGSPVWVLGVNQTVSPGLRVPWVTRSLRNWLAR